MGRLFIFITVDSKEVRQWTLLHHIPQRVTTMNRYRKKIQQSDDQVSIFDSEEDEPRQKKVKGKPNKQKKEGKKLVRAPSSKAIEKKLSKAEQTIMKELLGPEETNTGEQITTPHNDESEQGKELPLSEVKEEDTEVPAANAPVKNNLDDQDFRIEEEDLTWLDLQEFKPKPDVYPVAPEGYKTHTTSKPKSRGGQYKQTASFTPPQPYGLPPNYNHYPLYPSPINQRQPMPKYPHQSYQSGYSTPYSPYYPYNEYINPDMYKGYYGNAIYGHPPPFYPFDQPNRYAPTLPDIEDKNDPEPDIFDSQDVNGGELLGSKLSKSSQPYRDTVKEGDKMKMEEQTIKNQAPEERKAYRKRKRSQIIDQIQKWKRQFMTIEDEEEEDVLPNNSDNDPTAIKLFKQWRYDENITKVFNAAATKEQQATTEGAELKFQKSKTQGRTVMIEQVLSENPFLTQNEMAEVLKARDPLMNARIERSVVLRLLQLGGYKKKKIRLFSKDRNSHRNLSLRCDYALCYQKYLRQQYNIFYYDELILNEYFDKESGWCRIDDQIDYQPAKFINRSVVVLAVMSKEGVCKWEARLGNHTDKEYCFALSKITKTVGKGLDKKLIVANPVSHRKPRYLSQIAKRRDWDLLVLPVQAIYLNPLQAYFFQLKELLKRRKFPTLQKMFEEVVSILKECDRNRLGRKTMSRVELYIDKAVSKEPF